MFTKNISSINWQDLQSLIGEAESRQLEFKETVPLSNEEDRKQRKSGITDPRDQAVQKGSGIGDYGKNEILAELVAFSNAAGGFLILGIREEAAFPHRAELLTPVPYVEKLKRIFIDAIAALIEPRLPYAAVEAVLSPLADESGILLFECQPSMLGPHWVRSTRRPTIRREDRCDPLSMIEIHDMVLRNARRLENVNQRLKNSRHDFTTGLPRRAESIVQRKGSNSEHLAALQNPSNPTRGVIMAALEQSNQSVVAFRVSLVAHQPMQTPRLTTQNFLGPLGKVIIGEQLFEFIKPEFAMARRVLGGLFAESKSHGCYCSIAVNRDCSVQLDYMQTIRKSGEFDFPTLLRGVSSVLASFELLRQMTEMRSTAAEIEVSMESLGEPYFLSTGPNFHNITARDPQDGSLFFNSFTVAEKESFEIVLNELAADFLEAGNITFRLPRLSLHLAP